MSVSNMKYCEQCQKSFLKKDDVSRRWKTRRFCSKRCVVTFRNHQKYGNPLTRTIKRCSTCKKTKSIDDFFSCKGRIDNKQADCKTCNSQRGVQFKRKKFRNWTQERWDQYYIEQDGKCAIEGCNNLATQADHNHETGQPRAILCIHCNKTLSYFENDLFRNRYLAYLQKYQALQAARQAGLITA